MHGDLEMLMGILKLKALPSIYLAFICDRDLMMLKTTEPVQDEDSSRQPEETSSELTHLTGYSYYCDSDI